jgi:hypothetical protein
LTNLTGEGGGEAGGADAALLRELWTERDPRVPEITGTTRAGGIAAR